MKEEQWIQFQHQGPGPFSEWVSCYRMGSSGRLTKRTLKEIGQEVAITLNALANADGGTVLWGAELLDEPLGVPFDDRAQRIFFHGLEKSSDPPVKFRVSPMKIDGKTLIQFSVDSSPAVHLLRNGKAYRRVGAQNIPLSKEKVTALKEARAETWHEREVLPHCSLEDLDEDLITEFIGRLGVQGEAEQILHRPYGLVEYREGKPCFVRAAAYLFAKDPLRWHPRSGIELVRFEGSKVGKGSEYNVAERIRVEGAIPKIIGEAERMISGRIKDRVVVRDLFFREAFEYPNLAWKEALINAVAHRDYRLEGSSVEVWMFDDRIEVRSPGKLPGTVRIEQLLNQGRIHDSRNPLITRVLVDWGIMGGLGEGLRQIFREMDQKGLNPPELKEEGNFFTVVLRHASVMDEDTLAWLQRFSGQVLNQRQKRILAYAKAHGLIFSSLDYQKMGVSRDTAYNEIKELVSKGIVQGLKKHGKVYRILEPEERAATLPGLEWVKDALEKKGFFTLTDLKQPQSVPRQKALSLMRELARQGYFTLLGKGKGVQYHPTEKVNVMFKKKE